MCIVCCFYCGDDTPWPRTLWRAMVLGGSPRRPPVPPPLVTDRRRTSGGGSRRRRASAASRCLALLPAVFPRAAYGLPPPLLPFSSPFPLAALARQRLGRGGRHGVPGWGCRRRYGPASSPTLTAPQLGEDYRLLLEAVLSRLCAAGWGCGDPSPPPPAPLPHRVAG